MLDGAGPAMRYYAPLLAFGAAVLGPAWYLLAGTWYGVGVMLCGPMDMDWRDARRVMLFANLIPAVPILLAGPAGWLHPAAGLAAVGVAMAAGGWSVWVGFLGVREVFEVHARTAIGLLFAAPLPFLACLYLLVATSAGGSGSSPATPRPWTPASSPSPIRAAGRPTSTRTRRTS